MRRFSIAFLTAGFVISVLGASPGAVMAAAPTSSPTLISPSDGATVSSNPVFNWTAVTGASKYRIEVSTSNTFNPIVWHVDTVALHATPPTQLPTGALWWHVAGMDASLNVGPYAVDSFTRVQSTAPVPVGPTDGQTLHFPTDPTLFTWQPVAGATSYTIQISTTSIFTTATSYTTKNSSFALTDIQAFTQNDGVTPQSWYWRVQATLATSQSTEWSTPRSYQIDWSAKPTLETPVDGAIGVTEVVFSWDPVLGAAAYDIQYSPNPDFQNNTVNMVVDGTRYAPYPTLSNQAYYWHVRARAPGSNPNTGQWSDTHTFTREWSTQPLTVSPHWIVGSPDIPIVSNFEVGWTPAAASGAGWVDHASDYEVEISTAATFGTYYDCFTNHTTFSLYGAESGLTPSSGSYAEPGVCTFSSPTSSSPIPLTSGLTYYWRVRPVDLPNGLHGRWDLQAESNTPQRFIWDPTQPVPCGPLDGATVSTPALCWTHSSDADYYHVTINKHNGTLALEADTYATTYTPTVALNPADGPFSWHVEGTDGAVWTPQWLTPPTFNLAAPTTAASLDLLSPSTGTAGVLPPSLVWQPYTGASYYEVFYGTAPSTWNVTPLSGAAKLPYAAFTYGDRSSVLAGGSYYWEVKAFTAGDVLMATSDARTFKIGYDGDDLDWIMPWSSYLTPQCTTKTDPTGPSGRCVPTLGDTQRMSWIPDAQAQVYEVWVAKDIYFTNVYRRYRTTMTSITPRESFLDSTAGQSYYWFVQPCLDWNHLICGPDPTTVAGFNNAAAYKKNSAPVTGLTTLQAPTEPSPICIDANPCQIPDQITFSWNDYMTESQAAAYPDPVAGYNSTRVSQEAKEYEITVATSADFNAGSLIESKTKVDTNSYTPYSKTYPEGALWWRVQAVDGSGNELTASVTASVTKASPKITLTSPAASAVVSGVPYFRWTPQNWAAKYTIEIYKNGDTLFSPSNLFAGTGNTPTSIAAWVPTIAMPAGTYAWRVARVDVGGKAGPWSTGRVFTLQPAAPTLTAPADLATVNGSDMLFSWTGPANAVSYKIQTSASASFGTTIESQTTVMSSWSPTRLYTNGTYYWQVSILDSANNVLRTSGYRTFFVGTVPAPPATPSTYHAISPVRVLDTRSQTGLSAKLQANNAATFQVTGRGDVSPQIPTGATAVTGNVTVVNSNNGWAVYLGPSPIDKPTTSTINFIAGQVAGNGLTVALSATGTLSATFISSAGATTDLVFDVTGYFTPDMTGATYHPIDPVRELDTRSHNGLNQHLSANIPQTFTVAGRNGIPSSAVAVTGNVTVVNPTNAWAVYLGPASTSSPTTSTINFSANQVAGNNLTVALGGGGTLSATYMSTSGNTTDLVFDVTGYYTADATGVRFVPMSPARILDTRSNVGITGKIPANTPKSFLARAGGVPSSATGVTGNVTVVNETSGWAVFLGPTSNSAPTTSTINFVVGDVKGNGLTVALSASGTLYATYISTAGNKTDLVFDVTGYFVK